MSSPQVPKSVYQFVKVQGASFLNLLPEVGVLALCSGCNLKVQ
jgi:hypothetical protein